MLKGLGLGCTFFQQRHKAVELRAVSHVLTKDHVVDHGPGFAVEKIIEARVFEKGTGGGRKHLRDRNEGVIFQVLEADGRRADVGAIALEASVAVELG